MTLAALRAAWRAQPWGEEGRRRKAAFDAAYEAAGPEERQQWHALEEERRRLEKQR